MGFRTKLDYSDNRQILQREETHTVLSGASTFGVPFSGLSSGVDITTRGETYEADLTVFSTFSGNNSTTLFTWGDPRMSLADSVFSAITMTTSGETQESGDVYIISSSTTIDDNFVELAYTGVSFSFDVDEIIDQGGGNYSGNLFTNDFVVLSAGTLDFKERTIWVDNPEITRTDRLIVNRTPTPGYVLTCVDGEGMSEWLPFNPSITGLTIDSYWVSGTSGTFSLRAKNTSGLDATGNYSTASGYQTLASGDYSNSSGFLTTASSIASHAEGRLTTASGSYSHAEGQNTIASNESSHAEGIDTTASGFGSHAEGHTSDASGYGSHAEGVSTTASGDRSHAEGLQTTASGDTSHAEGQGTLASGDMSHAEGRDTIASGNYSHAEGFTTQALSHYSHSEGYFTISSGMYSHAEGQNTIASGMTSHAEGKDTTASGMYSHAEGSGTTASGDYGSHAEGAATTASGVDSHAQNWLTIASGLDAHAEGHATVSSGHASHSQGQNTTASGDASFSSGVDTIASGYASFAGGKGFYTGLLEHTNPPHAIVASGITSFTYFAQTAPNGFVGAYGNYSAILGGQNHNINIGATSSVILGGNGNSVNANIINSAVIGGSSINASLNNTVYVPDLVIDGLTSVTDLQTDANGLIIDGASDISLKTNINDLESALSKIKKLRGVSFDWTKESNMGGGKYFGLIAQEVKEVIPEIVKNRVKHKGHLTLDYKALIPWLVEAVKELSGPKDTSFTQVQIQTETITSEDSDLLLNFNGSHESSLNGGMVVNRGVNDKTNSQFIINSEGDWMSNTYIIPHGLVIPEFTPSNSSDSNGKVGEITRDDNYLYIKGKDGQWKRSNLETF